MKSEFARLCRKKAARYALMGAGAAAIGCAIVAAVTVILVIGVSQPNKIVRESYERDLEELGILE